MPKELATTHQQDATGRLHPVIYRVLIGFVAGWFIITLTFFSGGSGGGHAYGGMIALIVAVFGLVTVLIPLEIWRIGQHHPGRHNVTRPGGSVCAWLNKDFVIWQGHTTGLDAAVTVLLPGIAAMIGGIALAVVFHLTAP